MSCRILIAEDQADLAAIVADYVRAEGWLPEVVGDGAHALDRARSGDFDLLVLDLMLPSLDGLLVCKAIRSCADNLAALPIVMVTAQVAEIDRLLGLEAGADDYVCKPFSPRELMARIKAVLRRARLEQTAAGAPQPLQLDRARHAATLNAKPLSLTRTEFALLALLAQRPGVIFSRAQLLDAVRQDSLDVSDRAIDTHVKNLRRKLAEAVPDLTLIRSVYGVGYSLER
jgi:two-component system, OmpR family, response regulator BaeR